MLDSWIWRGNAKQVFSVKEVFNQLRRSPFLVHHTQDQNFLSCIWRSKVPSKVCAFVWRLSLDRIQSKENLMRRNVSCDSGGMICPVCMIEDETSVHAVFSCMFSYNIWMRIYSWFGISSVLPKDVYTHWWQHCGSLTGNTKRKRWWVVWMCTSWTIWRNRNDVNFNGTQVDYQKTLDLIVISSWKWLRAIEPTFKVSFYDWWSNPRLNI